jgi:hypothetical protein
MRATGRVYREAAQPRVWDRIRRPQLVIPRFVGGKNPGEVSFRN